MEQLRACPFCGGEGKLRMYGNSYKVSWVECEVCGAKTEVYDSEEMAVDAWNRRQDGKEGI